MFGSPSLSAFWSVIESLSGSLCAFVARAVSLSVATSISGSVRVCVSVWAGLSMCACVYKRRRIPLPSGSHFAVGLWCLEMWCEVCGVSGVVCVGGKASWGVRLWGVVLWSRAMAYGAVTWGLGRRGAPLLHAMWGCQCWVVFWGVAIWGDV